MWIPSPPLPKHRGGLNRVVLCLVTFPPRCLSNRGGGGCAEGVLPHVTRGVVAQGGGVSDLYEVGLLRKLAPPPLLAEFPSREVRPSKGLNGKGAKRFTPQTQHVSLINFLCPVKMHKGVLFPLKYSSHIAPHPRKGPMVRICYLGLGGHVYPQLSARS